MNLKKVSSTLMFSLLVLTTLVVLPAKAIADVDVPNCRIVKVGSDPRFQGPPVQLVDLSGNVWTGARQFYLSQELGNQGLAVVLSAYSMGETLWVRIAGNGSPGSLITIVFINQSQ
jgi:hypothetical protein